MHIPDTEAELPEEGRVLPRGVWFLLDLRASVSLLYFYQENKRELFNSTNNANLLNYNPLIPNYLLT